MQRHCCPACTRRRWRLGSTRSRWFMRSSWRTWLAFLILVQPATAQYKAALPGYHYDFPRDHFNHPDFQTEWWYFTGNVTATDGHRFGFELTFFREGVNREIKERSTWDIQDVYLA